MTRRVICRSCGEHVYNMDWPGHYPKASADDLRPVEPYPKPERGDPVACPACGVAAGRGKGERLRAIARLLGVPVDGPASLFRIEGVHE